MNLELTEGGKPTERDRAYKWLPATTPRRVKRFQLRLPLLQFISVGILANPRGLLKPFTGFSDGIFSAFFQLLDSLASIHQPGFHLHLQFFDRIGGAGHPHP